MPKYSLMLARFPGGWSNVQSEHPDTTDYMLETFHKAKTNPLIGDVYTWAKGDTPVPMIRNRCIETCKQLKIDLLHWVDSDMKPDAYLHTNKNRLGIDINAKPFFETSLDFLVNRYHREPCVVAAPYCGPSPHQNLYVFHWANWNSGRPEKHPDKDFWLEQFTRHEAAQRGGIEEVGALPTGLCLIDMRVFNGMPHPHFYYEWKGDGAKCEHCGQRKAGPQILKASTEDVAWSRDISMQWIATDGQGGGRIYCNWDAWAGHWKLECVGKPSLLSVDEIAPHFIEAVQRNQKLDDRLIMVGEGRYDPSIPIAPADFQQGKEPEPALANGEAGDAQPKGNPEE